MAVHSIAKADVLLGYAAHVARTEATKEVNTDWSRCSVLHCQLIACQMMVWAVVITKWSGGSWL